MSFPKFERAKDLRPELAPELDRALGYVERQVAAGQAFIIPKLAGAALGLTDGEAFVLLETLADAGVIERVYNVYCRQNDRLLATVLTMDDLDRIPYCDFCDKNHVDYELTLQLAFRMPVDQSMRRAA